jgi:hypothetical protein
MVGSEVLTGECFEGDHHNGDDISVFVLQGVQAGQDGALVANLRECLNRGNPGDGVRSSDNGDGAD